MRRAWLAALLGILAAFAAVPGSAAAVAAGTGPAHPAGPVVVVPANAVGDCLAAGKVWLVVVTDSGTRLANQCVGRPANGLAALSAAGLSLTYTSSGYICTMGGYPSTCPATFSGQYWQYYHSTNGTSWSYSTLGAPAYTYPSTGMIDGWCYNSASSSQCTPPTITVVAPVNTTAPTTASAPTARTTTTSGGSTTKPAPATTTKTTVKAPTSRTVGTNPGTPISGITGLPVTTNAASSAGVSSPATAPESGSPSTSLPSAVGTPTAADEATDPTATSASSTAAGTSSSSGPWGLIITGAVLVLGAASVVGWRWLRHR